MNFDVTEIARAWKDGAPNYGFYIGSTGTGDGWEVYTSGAFGAISPGEKIYGSEVADVSGQLAPELTILYVPTPVPEPASLGLIAAGGVLCLRRRRRHGRHHC
jgi:hypothetical protein